ncbi:cbb3-type cytochrome c oxidase subunit I [Rhodalgimonas zhirmunskyi]|uniref:Cbb3-type cytochrome c oxidase subunit I n=1 Tax=Rhodalgimonas zhirmunskyi TaxID=2964767 RepID=A0AAJ1UCH8_9RHOB|nr:cbb3-type cytochrome c oxidase subunit I [Rhodoalgimonas zhirmunskyi]MDQ2093647.1 cbb3-type cytochrome c oxidase subunit I [Rhodoalgimonas zhirmunskyi]
MSDWYWIFGNLKWNSLVFFHAFESPSASEEIAAGAALMVILGGLWLVWLLTVKGWWRPLWRDWLTSPDHKKIGIMYVVVALVMLARAVAEAVVMRLQQAVAVNDPGFLSADHFGQLFSTHGTIMIFFMAMPFLTGVINYVMPQQIGARDVSFPVMNAVSLALTTAGAVLVMVSLVFGQFETGGWTAYPPYTGIRFSPGEGVDYWIWAVSLSSIGTTLSGINFAVTIYKERAPGMTLMRMPLFTWTTLCTAILMIFAMIPLTAATAMLALDRYAGFHFFTTDKGGDMMNYANLFWLFGHPEVYILILPAFGVFSEVIPVFSGKRLYGYTSLVWATMAIAVLSFTVWLHHFFTMGQSANLNAVFGFATMTIGVPTGVKVYDWMLTMYRGRLRFTTAMLFSVMFLVTFVVGGITGVMLANPTVDFATHNTLFLVAHFHNMLIPGLLFGMIAAMQFWFPKAFGFRLDERWGKISFWCWSIGFYVAFMPLYALGLMGAMRRSFEWYQPEFLPYLVVAAGGALLILCGLIALFVQLWVSVKHRDQLRVPAGDPWDAHSLEWMSAAPAPEWNFAVIPEVHGREAFLEAKRDGTAYLPPERYEDIHLPAHSAMAPLIGVGALALGFGLTWHIWWMVAAGFIGIWAVVIARSFVTDTGHVIPADVVQREHERWLELVRNTPAVDRGVEQQSENLGHAEAVI